MGLTFCSYMPRDSCGWFVHKKTPGVGDIMKEPVWALDVDYLTQNDRNS